MTKRILATVAALLLPLALLTACKTTVTASCPDNVATAGGKCTVVVKPPTSTTTPPPVTSTTTAPPTTTTKPPVTTTTTKPPVTTTTTAPPTTQPPAGTCPGGVQPDVFDEGDGGTFGPYFIHNNAWNWQGGSQHELIYACEYNNWWLNAWGFAPNNGEVFTYPNVHLDINNLNGKPLSTWSTITGTFAGSGFGAGSYNVAWDLWLNGTGDGANELMIWTEKRGNAVPAGDPRTTYTDASGKVYDVWWDGGDITSFVSRTEQKSGTMDLKAFINFAISKGYMPASPTVCQLDYGIEVRDTAGATQTNPYRFTLTNFALNMR